MKELLLESSTIIEDIFSLRDRHENFALIVKGKRALKFFNDYPCYERYQDECCLRRRGRNKYFLSWAWVIMQSPTFWGACILADMEAKDHNFMYFDGVLRVEFYF